MRERNALDSVGRPSISGKPAKQTTTQSFCFVGDVDERALVAALGVVFGCVVSVDAGGGVCTCVRGKQQQQ